ncbi:MAG: hypothetical protein KF902_09250 [Phycisphaeraceae bacterium]|nr:hypothetical protein [Phycisphaeraceae bacterium]MCW5768852.1 hypothetical protein [Phycisphaeraceae bacterium]
MISHPSHTRARLSGRSFAVLCLVGSALLGGCHGTPARVKDSPNASLRPIDVAPDAPKSDADRSKLARLIGVWSFRGTVTDDSDSTREVTGTAAGVLENSHFVLLDVQATQGEFAGTAGRKSGSMLFGSEPGKGLTVTAWGDAGPEIRRLIGATNADGSVFEFRVMQGHGRGAGISMRIVFETDDRWSVTISRGTASASYVFSRLN